MIFCSKCGVQNSETYRFCQQCGADLLPTGAPASAAVAAPVYTAPGVSPYGGFWIRVVATIIDGLVLGVVYVPLCLIFVVPIIHRVILEQQGRIETGPPLWLFAWVPMIWLVVVVGQWLYDALLTSSAWQGTVGKKVLNLRVTDEAGNRISFARATGRHFAKIVSGMILYIGFIMVGFTQRKQGLHDIIAGTLVMKG